MTHETITLCLALSAAAMVLSAAAAAYPPGPFSARLDLTSVSLSSTGIGFSGLLTNTGGVYTITDYALSSADVYGWSGGSAHYYGLPYYATTPIYLPVGQTQAVSGYGSFAEPVELRPPWSAYVELYLIGTQETDPMWQPMSSIFVGASWTFVPEPSTVSAVLLGACCVILRSHRGRR